LRPSLLTRASICGCCYLKCYQSGPRRLSEVLGRSGSHPRSGRTCHVGMPYHVSQLGHRHHGGHTGAEVTPHVVSRHPANPAGFVVASGLPSRLCNVRDDRGDSRLRKNVRDTRLLFRGTNTGRYARPGASLAAAERDRGALPIVALCRSNSLGRNAGWARPFPGSQTGLCLCPRPSRTWSARH
jgi:hypothetical protein